MMRTFNPVRFEAMAELLARPDPRDLPRRAHVCRYPGDPLRRTTRFPGILMGWLQRHYLEVDLEEIPAAASAVPKYLRPRRDSGLQHRRQAAGSGLRVLRPTGTG
ncbi:MAG: hypothetical protein ABI868_02300 [Acidobacteriota bacterium]